MRLTNRPVVNDNALHPMVNAPTTRPTMERFSWKAALVASGRYELTPKPLKKARNDEVAQRWRLHARGEVML